MSRVLTIRIASGLIARAEARAARLGMGRAGYVRNLIEHDLKASNTCPRGQFASEDLVGSFRLGGKPATNQVTRSALQRRLKR